MRDRRERERKNLEMKMLGEERRLKRIRGEEKGELKGKGDKEKNIALQK